MQLMYRHIRWFSVELTDVTLTVEFGLTLIDIISVWFSQSPPLTVVTVIGQVLEETPLVVHKCWCSGKCYNFCSIL